MNAKTLLPAILLGLLCTTSAWSNVKFQELSLDEARSQATQQDKLFFLYFAADWCMPCRWMDQHTFSDSRLAEYANTHYLPVKVNIDKSSHKALSDRFSVTKLPTVLIFSAAGVLLGRAENSLDAPAMLSLLQTYDQPNHHRQTTVASAVAIAPEVIMESPRPNLSGAPGAEAATTTVFSRPALIPDVVPEPPTQTLPPPATTINPRPTPIITESKLVLAPQPMLVPEPIKPSPQPTQYQPTASATVSPASFTPRSTTTSARYGVQTALYDDYQQAVRETARLETKYHQSTELYPIQENGVTRYRVVMGAFSLRSEAERLHLYLRRNDILGEIISLP